MKIIIFAGGYGTRMWPASRKSFPKQFYPLIKGRSFFQMTVNRFKKKFKTEDIFISTEESYLRFIREQTPEIPKENLILEPERRDSLGAIGLVSAVIEKKFPGEVMFFSWSDHFIGEEDEFLRAVKIAGEICDENGAPVSLNEKPFFPNIHAGWIRLGEKIGEKNGRGVYKIEDYVEKPDEKTAKKLLKSGKYLIHTGYGAWKSDLMLGYFQKYRPKDYEALVKIAKAWGTDSQDNVLRREYKNIEKVSVEYGLFEKLPHDLRLTIAVSSKWEDAGTWELFYKAMKEGNEKNVTEGGVVTQFLNSQGNLVIGRRNKLISIIEINNLVVIDTDDALLVCPMDQTAKVKELFKIIEKDKPRYVE